MKNISPLAKRRVIRARARIKRFSNRLRLVVFRSNKYMRAQIIDTDKGIVLVSASDEKMEGKQTKTEKAFEVGREIGKKAKEKGIKEVVFDRGPYKFHGRVKAVSEGAKQEKLVI